MAFADLDGLTLKNVEQDLFRNIVSLRQGQDLFDDLSDHPEDWRSAINLELAFKPPFYESEQPVIDRPFEDAAHFSAIQFPFDHIGQSRFSAGKFGVWYGSELLETTVYETVYHWQNGLLADAGFQNINDVKIERRVYWVHCEAALVNLLPMAKTWPQLTANDYGDCQFLGNKLHRQGYPGGVDIVGAIYWNECGGFTPKVLSKPRDYCYLTYHRVNGRVNVYRDPDTVWFSI